MCYHLQTPLPEEIEAALHNELSWMKKSPFEKDYLQNQEYEKIYHSNGFNHDALPALTAGQPARLQLLQWGLIPAWAKNIEQARELQNMTLNATCENIFDKPAFREPALGQRCVIMVTGFFENRHEGKKKYPYFVRVKNERIFFLGGLYSHWADKNSNTVKQTCTIITTPANALMAKIHNSKKRMPLIISKHQLENWLNPKASRETVTSLMTPFDELEMQAHTISPLINGSRTHNTNLPEVTKEVIYPELQMLDAMF